MRFGHVPLDDDVIGGVDVFDISGEVDSSTLAGVVRFYDIGFFFCGGFILFDLLFEFDIIGGEYPGDWKKIIFFRELFSHFHQVAT